MMLIKQMVELDEQTGQWRHQYQYNIHKRIKELVTYFRESNSLIVEKAFQLLVPKFVESINCNKSCPQIDDKFQELVKKKLSSQQKLFYYNRTAIISQDVKKQIEKYQDNYKFQFFEIEIGEMELDLQLEIQKYAPFKYFDNSIWYYSPQMSDVS